MTHDELRFVAVLRRDLQDAKLKVLWHEREAYRLRRLAANSERLERRLEAKTAALEFSIQRQEVLRRQLTKALGGGSARANYDLEIAG